MTDCVPSLHTASNESHVAKKHSSLKFPLLCHGTGQHFLQFCFRFPLAMSVFLVFRKSKDLYLIITQKLIIHEIRQISGEIHPKLYKFRCFSKNSSVWGGCMEGAMTPDFMKSKVIAPLLHSSNWIVFVETSEFIRFWVDFMWNRKTSCKEL